MNSGIFISNMLNKDLGILLLLSLVLFLHIYSPYGPQGKMKYCWRIWITAQIYFQDYVFSDNDSEYTKMLFAEPGEILTLV